MVQHLLVNLEPSKTTRANPYGENYENILIVFFTDQKKCLVALNAVQKKTSNLCNVRFVTNQEKLAKMGNFLKDTFFGLFLEFCCKHYNAMIWVFLLLCVAIGASRHFLWSIKINFLSIFQIFHYKRDPYNFGGLQNYKHNLAWYKIENKNCVGISRAASHNDTW